MPIPNRFTITSELAIAQSERIERCRSAACFIELALTFGTASATDLEKIIDGASGKDEDGFATYSGKYRRLISLSKKLAVTRMSDKTVKSVERTSKGRAKVKRWRDHVLFDLLQEPPISSEAVHQILVQCSPWIRRHIFIDSLLVDPTPPVVLPRFPLDRDTVLAIRNRRSLDAFVALLALAREAEHGSHQQEHSLTSACAREIFPYIVKDHPHLRARWVDLYECLKISFWSRGYLAGGFSVPIGRFEFLEGIVAILRDPDNPKLPFSIGITSAEVARKKPTESKIRGQT